MLLIVLNLIILISLAIILVLVFKLKRKDAENLQGFEKRREIAEEYLKEHEFITNDVYQELTGISDAQATRDLVELSKLGLISEKIGKTRGIKYKSLIKA